MVKCPKCNLPMSLGPHENLDENTGMDWYCDGPNSETTNEGCGFSQSAWRLAEHNPNEHIGRGA